MKIKLSSAIVCLLLAGLCRAQTSDSACHSVSFDGSVAQHQKFEKDFGSGLLFRVLPKPPGKDIRNQGWIINIVPQLVPGALYDTETKDYILIVNYPLHESSSQILGHGYDVETHGYNTSEQSLNHPHEMRFLLSSADYDVVFSAFRDNMKPIASHIVSGNESAKNNGEETFLKIANSVPTGWLSFYVLSSEIDPNGVPLRIQFHAELTTPSAFKFADDLKTRAVPCVTHVSTAR
jgi:hypothetical protein